MKITESINNNKPKKTPSDEEQLILTPKIYQHIYHQITGRTEKISKSYKNNLLIDFEEVKQLHYKLLQLTDIYQVVTRNEAIVIYYDNDRKEEFTSFERFETYNSSKSKPTLNLVLKYNFLLKLPDFEDLQSYTLTIKFTSRLAMIEAIEREAPTFVPYGLLAFMHSTTAEINVEYVDYVIARSFVESFDEWVKGCHSVPKNKYLKFFQSNSKYSSTVLQIVIGLILINSFLIIIESLPEYFSHSWGRFFIISFLSFFFFMKTSNFLGSILEKYIDSFYEDSYLKLTRGDEKLIRRSESRKRGIILKIFINICLTIVLGIISSKLAIYI